MVHDRKIFVGDTFLLDTDVKKSLDAVNREDLGEKRQSPNVADSEIPKSPSVVLRRSSMASF